jgi:hypothetical protein
MSDKQSPFIVVGIDPGKTTGMFLYSPQGRIGPGWKGLKPFYAWQQFGAEDAPRTLNGEIVDLTTRYGPRQVHIAVERFIINSRTAKSSQQADALEITGMVKGFARLYTPNPVQQYMKANLKFANDDALRRAGWYSPQMGHATDAARQAYALLKDVDYPAWLAVSNGAMMKIEDETKGRHDA